MFLVSILSSTVGEEWQINTPQVNGISFTSPTSPPLSQPQDEQKTLCYYGEVIIFLFLFHVQVLGIACTSKT